MLLGGPLAYAILPLDITLWLIFSPDATLRDRCPIGRPDTLTLATRPLSTCFYPIMWHCPWPSLSYMHIMQLGVMGSCLCGITAPVSRVLPSLVHLNKVFQFFPILFLPFSCFINPILLFSQFVLLRPLLPQSWSWLLAPARAPPPVFSRGGLVRFLVEGSASYTGPPPPLAPALAGTVSPWPCGRCACVRARSLRARAVWNL